jgi:hypothetical protein
MTGPYPLAALGALLVGAGLACIAEATRKLKPCVDCEDDPVDTISEVAAASAEMVEPE